MQRHEELGPRDTRAGLRPHRHDLVADARHPAQRRSDAAAAVRRREVVARQGRGREAEGGRGRRGARVAAVRARYHDDGDTEDDHGQDRDRHLDPPAPELEPGSGTPGTTGVWRAEAAASAAARPTRRWPPSDPAAPGARCRPASARGRLTRAGLAGEGDGAGPGRSAAGHRIRIRAWRAGRHRATPASARTAAGSPSGCTGNAAARHPRDPSFLADPGGPVGPGPGRAGSAGVPGVAGSAAPRTRTRGRSRSRDHGLLDRRRPDQGRPELAAWGRWAARCAWDRWRPRPGDGAGGWHAEAGGRGGREGSRAPSASGWPVGSLVTCALPSSGHPRRKAQKTGG